MILDNAMINLIRNGENYINIKQEAIEAIKDQNAKNQLEGILAISIPKINSELRCGVQFTADYLKINPIIADLRKKLGAGERISWEGPISRYFIVGDTEGNLRRRD